MSNLLFIFVYEVVSDVHRAEGISKVTVHVTEAVQPRAEELWDAVSIYIELATGVYVLPG